MIQFFYLLVVLALAGVYTYLAVEFLYPLFHCAFKSECIVWGTFWNKGWIFFATGYLLFSLLIIRFLMSEDELFSKNVKLSRKIYKTIKNNFLLIIASVFLVGNFTGLYTFIKTDAHYLTLSSPLNGYIQRHIAWKDITGVGIMNTNEPSLRLVNRQCTEKALYITLKDGSYMILQYDLNEINYSEDLLLNYLNNKQGISPASFIPTECR